jgi:hypothetical protein
MLVMAALMCQSASGVCQVPQPRLLCAEYSNSQAVVAAKLTHRTEIGDNDGHRYSFLLQQSYLGHVPNHFVLWEENASGRATFEWKTGREYLLFLSYSQPDHAWTIDGCGNSGPLTERSEAISQIKHFAKHSGPAIVSGIVTTGSWTDGVSGVTITATTDTNAISVVSDAEGRFQFSLIPGDYRFHASKAGKQFQAGIIQLRTS